MDQRLEYRDEVRMSEGAADVDSVDPNGILCVRMTHELLRGVLPFVLADVLLLGSCGGAPPSGALGGGEDRGELSGGATETTSDSRPDDWFVDLASDVGLDFLHFNGAAGDFLYPEILPPGVGLFDYDNDGDLDVFVVQGRMLRPDQTPTEALMPPNFFRPGARLYRNDLTVSGDGQSVLAFTDVTDQSEIVADGYGLGVATGDFDNDGWVDLFVTNFGPGQLFRNLGGERFIDVSHALGIENDREFGVSAAFVDYDRDGWLDLYVANNVDYDLDDRTECPNMAGSRDYCPPQTYGGTQDRLYRNRGDGTFEDVNESALQHTVEIGVARTAGGRLGPALGVATADYDGDGWIDIYVANDGTENLLWLNQQDGTFRNQALLAGAALSGMGTPEASMGVAAGDFDNDGDEDLFMTHLRTEGNNLYVNDGSGIFQDRSAASELGSPSLPYTGWGTAWFDYDNDGWLDLLTVNGAVDAEGRASTFPYDQRKTLFRNLGTGRFEDVTDQAGTVFDLSEVGRGAAFGDIDNDGDVDVLVGNNSGPIRLLINTIGNRNHWLGLRLVGQEGRDMLGARVEVIRADGSTLWRRVRTDGSYASANDPRILVGLGARTESPTVRVHWPSGRAEEFSVAVDQWVTLTESAE